MVDRGKLIFEIGNDYAYFKRINTRPDKNLMMMSENNDRILDKVKVFTKNDLGIYSGMYIFKDIRNIMTYTSRVFNKQHLTYYIKIIHTYITILTITLNQLLHSPLCFI